MVTNQEQYPTLAASCRVIVARRCSIVIVVVRSIADHAPSHHHICFGMGIDAARIKDKILALEERLVVRLSFNVALNATVQLINVLFGMDCLQIGT